jgi:hypothetical protein
LDIAMIAAALTGSPDAATGMKGQVRKSPTPWQTTGKWEIGGA